MIVFTDEELPTQLDQAFREAFGVAATVHNSQEVVHANDTTITSAGSRGDFYSTVVEGDKITYRVEVQQMQQATGSFLVIDGDQLKLGFVNNGVIEEGVEITRYV